MKCRSTETLGLLLAILSVVFIRDVSSQTTSQTLKVKEQGEVSLSCATNAQNASTIEWYHDDQLIKADDRITLYENENGSLLKVDHFNQKDEGLYSCKSDEDNIITSYNLTFEGAIPPGKPEAPTYKNLTSRSVILEWNSSNDNGWNITNYYLYIRYVLKNEWNISRITDKTSAEIQDLVPFTNYQFQLVAENIGGKSENSSVKDVNTLPATPGDAPTIQKIKANICQSLGLEWMSENELFGNFDEYVFRYHDHKTEKNHSTTLKEKVNSFTISGLSDDTMYTVTMAVRNQEVGLGPYSKPRAEKTLPLNPNDIKPPSKVVNNASFSNKIFIEWEKPMLLPMFGEVKEYEVRYKLSDRTEFDTKTVNTTNITLTELTPDSLYLITLTTITSCGPGKPSEELSIYTKLLSNATTESPTSTYSFPSTKDPRNRRSIVVIAISTLLAVLIIILLVLALVWLVYRWKGYQLRTGDDALRGKFKPVPGNDTFLPGEISGPYISVEAFPKHVARNHLDTDLIFSEEYEHILEDSSINGATFNAAKEPDNKEKNRYVNILPYDHSRVKLHQLAGKCKYSDYINANYVDGYQKPHAFIATQGPLRSTCEDFWGMVWEQQSCVIVMLTNLVEKGRTKCDKYWPSGQMEQYGHFKVTVEDVQVMASFIIRRFSLKNTHSRMAGERVVWQFHYTCWPDHGVPEDALPLLTFIRKSTSVNPDHSGPIIVHCSAGVGRTGTYIVLDTMIRQIRDKQTINVEGFLKYIRRQRSFLVQTEEQYVFIHDALLEYLQFGVTHVQEVDLVALVNGQLENAEEGQETLLEKQFKQIMSYKHKDFEFSSARKPVNIPKNRSPDLLPVERSKVNISPKPGVDGSEYVNASWLPGYGKELEYIVSQHPLPTTVEDFWQMVWDHNSPTIVMLSNEEDKEANDKPVYWPVDKDNSLSCNSFTVNLLEEKTQEGSNHLVIREFLLQSMDDYSLQVRQFHISNWPDGCLPMKNVFQLVDLVETWRQGHPGRVMPVTVHDSCGGYHAGVFCALSNLRQQLKEDGEVDVCQIVDLYNRRRPGMFTDKEGYRFLYRALEGLVAQTPHKVMLSVSRSSSLRSSRPRHALPLSSVRRTRTMQPQPRPYHHQREREEEVEEEVADSSV